MLFNIFLTFFFVLLNAFFVAAEFALVKVRLSQLELSARSGNKLAGVSISMTRHLDAYLSATQLGITIASLALGWIGESVVAGIIIDIFNFAGYHVSPALAHKVAAPGAFIVITFLHIILGELAPKSLAIQYPEKVTAGITVPLRIFYIVFRPVIWALNSLANAFIRLMGLEITSESSQVHSAEELRYLLEESSKGGAIGDTETKLIENVFDFPETDVKQVMVPRNKVVAIEKSMATEDIFELFVNEGYSRFPVYEKTLDRIVGEIFGKDLLTLLMHRNLIALADIIRPAYFVSEEEKIDKLLREMQKRRIHMAVVLDEFGGTAGIVTMEDILEELVGEIQDEYDEETPAVVIMDEKVFKVDAGTPVADVNEAIPLPLPESEDYETVGGYITSELGRLPEENESFELGGYSFLVLSRSQTRIEIVQMTVAVAEEEDEEEE